MCDEDKRIVLEAEENSNNITITIEPYGVWKTLSEEKREQIMRDDAHWDIVKAALKYELGKGFSAPNFNSIVLKLRQMIVTDAEFVNDITVEFIKQILREWAKVEQERREARQAFYKLYNIVREDDRLHNIYTRRIKAPYDINKNDDYMRVSTKEVRSEIMEKFAGLLKEYEEKS